jgi:NAD(P)-dependent dehydrogenase (short-subunit alcohol dehydrogenase family)
MSNTQFDLTGGCAVVLGGTTGVGGSFEVALARAGANVISLVRESDPIADKVFRRGST